MLQTSKRWASLRTASEGLPPKRVPRMRWLGSCLRMALQTVSRYFGVGVEDELAAACGGVAGGEMFFELGLHGGGLVGEDDVAEFGFAAAPGWFVADEVADEPGVVLLRGERGVGGFIDVRGEGVGVDVGEAHPGLAGGGTEVVEGGATGAAGGHAPGIEAAVDEGGVGGRRGGQRGWLGRCRRGAAAVAVGRRGRR